MRDQFLLPWIIILFSCLSTTAQVTVTVDEARQLPFGTFVIINDATIVNLTDLIESDNLKNFQIEDETGAITVLGFTNTINNLTEELQIGSKVNAFGVTGAFFGLAQLQQNMKFFGITDLKETVSVQPTKITTEDLLDFSKTGEALESRFVSLNRVSFLTKGNPADPGDSFAGVENYVVTDGVNEVTIRISTNDLANMLGTVPFGHTRIRGVFLQFDLDTMTPIGYQVSALEVIVLGDLDGSGRADILDVVPFVELLTSSQFQDEADINDDGVVDVLDVLPFVKVLTGQ